MQPSVAEVRAGAVAKLKRATSLPRIKGGRRPPMHSEGASEGEKSKDDSSKQGDDSSKNTTSDEREEPVRKEYQQHELGPNGQPPPTSTSPKRKRRSRSRSRSKDLKDLKQSPTPRDSSPEDRLGFLPADDIPVVSPTPSRPAGMPGGIRVLFSPPPAHSPSSPQGATPTLQDLQQRLALGSGLFRSQSASRTAAMLKLTGGASGFDAPQPASSPKIVVSRSNTVTGGEQRAAAARHMLGRLQHRVGGQTDDLATSGGEDAVVPTSPKKRRRRSRKPSGVGSTAGASPVVDDRDPPSTSPNTPVVSSSPLPPPQIYPESPHLPLESPSLGPPPPLPPPPPPPAVAPSPPRPEEESHDTDVETSHPKSHPSSGKQWTFELEPRRRTRDVVVEEDEVDEPIIGPSLPPPPPRSRSHTPQHDTPADFSDSNLGARDRAPHSSDAPSVATTVSSGHLVPVIMSGDPLNSPYKEDVFPKSPFNTPLKERPRDEDEEEIVYREEMKARRIWSERVANGNGIEWPGGYAAEESVIPVQHEDDDDAVDPLTPAPSSHHAHTSAHHDPRNSEFASPSPIGTSCAPPSPSSVLALSHSTGTTRESVDSSIGPSPGLANFPNTTGVFALRPESCTDPGTDWEGLHSDKEEVQTDRETQPKRTVDGAEKTAWAKVKTFVGRSSSISGRRSRTNSTTKREEKAANRESGASGSTKAEQTKFSDHGPPSAWSSPGIMQAQLVQEQQRQQPMQSASASASILSLTPTTPHRGGASPVPPASPADLPKYANSKLMPFPGLVKLDEERKKQRSRGMSASASASMSSPNLPRGVTGTSSDALNANRPYEVESRERKLSHQHSDSRLLPKFREANVDTEPLSPTSNQSVSPSAPSSSWLPMSRKDVPKWYQINKFFSSSQPSTSISPAMISSPIVNERFDMSVDTGVKPSTSAQRKLSDLLVHQQSSDISTDWEEDTSNTSTTPKGRGKGRIPDQDTLDPTHDQIDSSQGERRVSDPSSTSSCDSVFKRDSDVDHSSANHTPVRPPLAVIPEPIVSDGSWTPSHTNSSSSVPSYKTSSSPETPLCLKRPSMVFRRLDTLLSRDPNDTTRWSFLEDPPRKLNMKSFVTQVVDSDTIRERYLFLFNDILVVAKPLVPTDKAMDRTFMVKNVIDLHTVQVIANRDEGLSPPTQNPLVQQFVQEFSTSPDMAVQTLLRRSGLEEDQVMLGKLFFNTFELDRTRLGAYLSKKSRKTVFRSYLDCFGFTSVRIDCALRTFMLSIRLPAESPEHTLDYLLSTFASRWFDANARLVSFDKDLATKLVRIIVHLNHQIHRTGGQINGYGLRDFREEWESMVRALDHRGLLLDETSAIYDSLWNDPLYWAADTHTYSIAFKRPPPAHLAYRDQSDPITLRIPHPDSGLRVQLFSQEGLVFEPQELNFTRSVEVTFRVTGTSLGPKSIIFSLVGPRATLYSGIPFSKTVIVERHFMRNTFQVAFDQRGIKRRYMFSAEDALVCHQWAQSLRQPRPTKSPRDPDLRRIQKAAKALSLDILRESLARKLSECDLIVICKQNSLIPAVLPTVTNIPPSS